MAVSNRRRARAIAVARPAAAGVPWWVWAVLAAGLVAAVPAMAQTSAVPDKIAPPSDAAPRSENPLVGQGTRPIPDTGVIKPPATGAASSAVIQPPVSGTMPVITPPKSPVSK